MQILVLRAILGVWSPTHYDLLVLPSLPLRLDDSGLALEFGVAPFLMTDTILRMPSCPW
jgi:hypothetical protein